MRALLLAALALAACSTAPAAPEHRALVRFEVPADGSLPAFLDVPFPSDLYREADGSLARDVPGLELYIPENADHFRDALDATRGFSRFAGASFRLDAPPASDGVVDPATLPAGEADTLAPGASVVLLDLDAADPGSARLPARAKFHDDRPRGGASPPSLAVLPARGALLPEGHRVAAVVTTDVALADGTPLAPSAGLLRVTGGARDRPGEDVVGAAWDQALALAPELEGRVAGLATYTTMASAGELVALREAAGAAPISALSWDAADCAPMYPARFSAEPLPSFDATLDAWLGAPAKLPDGSDDPARDQDTGAAHDALAAIGTAVFEAPNFLLDRPGGYDDPLHRTLSRDASGAFVPSPERPSARIWVSLALPKGAVPAAGFPTVILQHGLQGDRSFLLTLANTYARQGWATVAIEAVTFGARSDTPTFTVDAEASFPWSAQAGAYAGPDGLVDTNASAIAFFGNFTGFGAMRDQLRQSAVDFGALARLLADPALDLGPLAVAVPGARLDASRLAYVGDSFGSIVGSMVASVEPRIGAFVLNVGGGGIITEIGARAPTISGVLSGGANLVYGVSNEWLDEAHPASTLLQTIIEPGDPLTHAHRIVREPAVIGGAPNDPKSVILIEVVWDELVSNEGSEALARAAGFPLAEPNVGPNGGVDLPVAPAAGGVTKDVPALGITAVLVQASPASHGSDLYGANGTRSYAPPFGVDGPQPFVPLPTVHLKQPYLGLQAMTVGFFLPFFAGAVPELRDVPVPRRDFDDDGVDDAEDPAPLDPAVP